MPMDAAIMKGTPAPTSMMQTLATPILRKPTPRRNRMGHRHSAAKPKRNMVTSAGAREGFIASRVAADQPDQISASARAHNTPPLFSAGVNDGVAVVVMTPPCCAVLG